MYRCADTRCAKRRGVVEYTCKTKPGGIRNDAVISYVASNALPLVVVVLGMGLLILEMYLPASACRA